MYAALQLICQTVKAEHSMDHHSFGPHRPQYEQPSTAAHKPNTTEWFYTWSPPVRVEPRQRAHIMSPVHQWCTDPRRAHTHTHIVIHRHQAQPPPPHVPVAPAPGHLAQGSKAVCRSNQSSQWATPLIQFYFISGEQTTRGVCTFLGSCGPGVILSLNDPRSGSSAIIAWRPTWSCLLTELWDLCGRRNKDRHSSFSGHGREVKQN